KEISKFVKNFYESRSNETYKDMEVQLAETSKLSTSTSSQEDTELRTNPHLSQLYCFKTLPQPKNVTEDKIRNKIIPTESNGKRSQRNTKTKFKIMQSLLKIK
ncbi:2434_t:CDS:2, partial [Scutellospora calospora]